MIEQTAKLRKSLPLGGRIRQDYVFDVIKDGKPGKINISDLFLPGKNSLLVYSFMFGPAMENACPSCTSIIDGFNAIVQHVYDRMNLIVVAKSPIGRIMDFARSRNWQDIKLLSSFNNNYNSDYHAETPEGNQLPACNVFTKQHDGIYYFYSTELLYTPLEEHPRHMDLM